MTTFIKLSLEELQIPPAKESVQQFLNGRHQTKNKVDQLLQEATRSNGKRLLSQDEAVSLAAVVITPKRTAAEQAQRDQFLAAVKAVKNWSTMLTFYTERENWSEVKCLLKLSDRTCEMLHEAFAHLNNKDGN